MKDESLLLTGWCARLEKELLSCGLNSVLTKSVVNNAFLL